MATIGAELADVAPGRVAIALAIEPRLSQQHGFLHAGVVTAALDSACGYAAWTLMPADMEVLTVEFKVNLLAPANGERLVAEGEVVRAGRTLTVCSCSDDAGDDDRPARPIGRNGLNGRNLASVYNRGQGDVATRAGQAATPPTRRPRRSGQVVRAGSSSRKGGH